MSSSRGPGGEKELREDLYHRRCDCWASVDMIAEELDEHTSRGVKSGSVVNMRVIDDVVTVESDGCMCDVLKIRYVSSTLLRYIPKMAGHFTRQTRHRA